MSHTTLFKKFSNGEGVISCIVHRDRYLDAFKSLGFAETANEAIALPDAAPNAESEKLAADYAEALEIANQCAQENAELKEKLAVAENQIAELKAAAGANKPAEKKAKTE